MSSVLLHHAVWKVTTLSGEAWALDPTAQQFGWEENVMAWSKFKDTRIMQQKKMRSCYKDATQLYRETMNRHSPCLLDQYGYQEKAHAAKAIIEANNALSKEGLPALELSVRGSVADVENFKIKYNNLLSRVLKAKLEKLYNGNELWKLRKPVVKKDMAAQRIRVTDERIMKQYEQETFRKEKEDHLNYVPSEYEQLTANFSGFITTVGPLGRFPF
jgi:hypothetical protein